MNPNAAHNAQHGRVQMLRTAAEACGFTEVELDGSVVERWVALRGGRDGLAVEIHVREEGLTRELWTRVRVLCPGVPFELTLRPELAGEGIDKLLGMTLDQDLGDPQFDKSFVVESAPPEAAPRVLPRSVRQDLLALPRTEDSPMLTLSDGLLTISFRGEPVPSLVYTAVSAARVIREMAAELHEGLSADAGVGPFRQVLGGERAIDPRARAAARSRIARSRRRVVTVVTSVAVAGASIIAGLLAGGGLPHLGGLL